MEWRIYYGDGSTFSSDDGDPRAAPGDNVAVVVQRDERTGRMLCARRDFYAFHDEQWYGHDLIGLIDYLRRAGIVKLGRTLPNDLFSELMSRAATDEGFPRKSARGRGEPYDP